MNFRPCEIFGKSKFSTIFWKTDQIGASSDVRHHNFDAKKAKHKKLCLTKKIFKTIFYSSGTRIAERFKGSLYIGKTQKRLKKVFYDQKMISSLTKKWYQVWQKLTFGSIDQTFVTLPIPPYCFSLLSGQSYKASTSINYNFRVVNISNLLVITTLES